MIISLSCKSCLENTLKYSSMTSLHIDFQFLNTFWFQKVIYDIENQLITIKKDK